MTTEIQPGDRVMLQLRANEIFDGTVVRVLPNSLDIRDIYNHANGATLKEVLTFYREEISDIRRINAKNNDEAPNKPQNGAPRGNYSSKSIIIPEAEFYRLRDMGRNYIYIDRFDEQYKKAMDSLYQRESIAVAGVGLGRRKRLNLLMLSDFKQTYIFDMMNLIELRGIKGLLTSEYITKIVHGGALLYDHLYHHFQVEMVNVFDTQMTDSAVSKKEDPESKSVERDLGQCLTHRFNLPDTLLSSTLDVLNSSEWEDRPLSKSQKTRLCELVIYLPTLRDHLQKLIMKDIINNTQKKYDQYIKATDLQLAELIQDVTI